MFDGLTDEHAIKWVSMQSRKFVKVEDSSFIERKCRNPVSFPLLHDERLDPTRQWEFPKCMLHGYFPNRHRAEQHVVSWIREDLFRGR